jgi:glycosidase
MKNIHSPIVVLFFCMSTFNVSSKNKITKPSDPPAWSKTAIWYQIMVERFHNGDPKNDPTPALMKDEKMKIVPPANWKITPWKQSWYQPDSWMSPDGKDFNDMIFYRRYGGDLKGVMDKLDYLQDLGINAIYFNPLNDAPSLHKYDARSYHHIDVNFGPDPEGDLKLIASENPNDPATWKWTAADKLFLELVKEIHKRGMKVILDFSWNHTGTQFWAWLDVLKNQQNSPYKDWYNISRFDDPATPENEFHYEGWMGNAYMPELKKTDIKSIRVPGNPYEGNIQEAAKRHIFDVTLRWLAPFGKKENGIDGFRLDVADHIGLGFWRDWRNHVRSINPDAYLVGEIWWQQWPDNLMDPLPYLKGDVFDAVMFYQVYRPARYFFANTDYSISAEQLRDSLQYHWRNLNTSTVQAMMNVSSSHDAPRLMTDFYNPNKYKYHANTRENPLYRTGKADKESMQRLRLYLMHLFTIPGAPQIWNGDEMGMWGADDPHCRKPLMWPEMKFEPEKKHALKINASSPVDKIQFNKEHHAFYKKLIQIRNENPVLALGATSFVYAKGKVLGYKRHNAKAEVLILLNLSEQPFTYSIDSPKINLMNGKKVSGKVVVKPLTGVILK